MYNECTSQGYMVSPFPSPLSCGHYDASGVLREAAARRFAKPSAAGAAAVLPRTHLIL